MMTRRGNPIRRDSRDRSSLGPNRPPPLFSSAESLKPQATSAWISRRSWLILRIARATPASVDPSAYS
jgi:hypothetical protein